MNTRSRFLPIPLLGAALSLCLLAPQELLAQAPEAASPLTAMGAERAGNAEGSIPEWAGGLTQTPEGSSGFISGVRYPDPFADETPLFTISATNLAEHRERLSAGEQALLRQDPERYLSVFASHRSAAVPAGYQQDSLRNASSGAVMLGPGDEGVVGTSSGVPFPQPHNGLEAIWNALTRYRGESFETQSQLAAVTRSGDYTLVSLRARLRFIYGAQTLSPEQRGGNRLLYFMLQTLAPPRLAGTALLVHDPLNPSLGGRKAWAYNPASRRVRLAPDIAYDSPAPNADGLRTDDDFALFSGATDRYDWILLGKRELYVPYNAYRVLGPAVSVMQLLQPRRINPAFLRYELHRVWVVEARLKPGKSHIYARRVLYLDEDSWTPLRSEAYDQRGSLWRVGESHLLQIWDVPLPFSVLEVLYDLQSGRYLASRLYNGSDRLYRRTEDHPDDFTPERLRQLVLR